jgi:hypothetical protein
VVARRSNGGNTLLLNSAMKCDGAASWSQGSCRDRRNVTRRKWDGMGSRLGMTLLRLLYLLRSAMDDLQFEAAGGRSSPLCFRGRPLLGWMPCLGTNAS